MNKGRGKEKVLDRKTFGVRAAVLDKVGGTHSGNKRDWTVVTVKAGKFALRRRMPKLYTKKDGALQTFNKGLYKDRVQSYRDEGTSLFFAEHGYSAITCWGALQFDTAIQAKEYLNTHFKGE